MSLKPEQIAHINIVNWFNYHFPEYDDDFHHFANERKCSVMEGRTLKRMGVKKGVADFHLAIPLGSYHGLWLELKVGKGKPSIEQSKFIERKNARGYLAFVVNGEQAAKDAILYYLDGPLTNCFLNTQKNGTNN